METIHTHSRKKKSTTKTSVIIAIVVHVLMAVAGAFWAAHEGMLGAKLQNLAVFMVPKEKKADEPKKAEPKEVAKKEEEPKEVQQAVRSTPAPPKFEAPPGAGGPAAPPPAAIIPAISFANALDSGDSVAVYKQRVETALRSRWDRPSGVQDLDYV